EVRTHITRSGKQMAFAEVEDRYGSISVLVWPGTWERTRELWQVDNILFLRGRIDAEGRAHKLLCDEATPRLEIMHEVPAPEEEPPPYEPPPPPELPAELFPPEEFMP
ncbi:MAG: OB-fold nucleic acid binding domain-containing protein, partial [Anaerolineae bacterium]